jgi:septum formation protein
VATERRPPDSPLPKAEHRGALCAVQPQLALASASPRRRGLLDQIGIRYRVVPVAVDESQRGGESPRDFVLRLALAKARAGAALGAAAGLPVLAADTAVVIDDAVLGKPADREQGLAMLARLSGRTHRVLSAVAMVAGREATRLSESAVTFRSILESEQDAYWATAEGRDKAGGYAIQGRGAVFVAHLTGSYSGVMGLPLFETTELLVEFGISLWAN